MNIHPLPSKSNPCGPTTFFLTFSNEFCSAASESACGCSPARILAFRCPCWSPLHFSLRFPTNSVPTHRNLRVAAVLRGIVHSEAHVDHPVRFVAFCNEFCAAASASACGCSPPLNLAFRSPRITPYVSMCLQISSMQSHRSLRVAADLLQILHSQLGS